jgi:hypothetical protein
MVGFPVSVHSSPDLESVELATLEYTEYTRLLG